MKYSPMKHRMTALAILSAAFLVPVPATLLPVAPAMAQSLNLDQAKSQGLVGERADGYLGVVQNAAGVQRLVDEVNLQRRQLYRDIAAKNGIPVNAVEQLAGKKAIERAASDTYVQAGGGGWTKKP